MDERLAETRRPYGTRRPGASGMALGSRTPRAGCSAQFVTTLHPDCLVQVSSGIRAQGVGVPLQGIALVDQ